MIKTIYRNLLPYTLRKIIYRIRHPKFWSRLIFKKAGKASKRARVIQLEAKSHLARWELFAALSKAREATRLDPLLIGAYLIQIQTLSCLGRRGEAVELACRVRERFPLSVGLLRAENSLGVFPAQLSQEEVLALVFESNTPSAAAQHAMEYLYFFGRFEQALELVELGKVAAYTRIKVQSRRNAHVDALTYWKAMCLEGAERYDEAERSYGELLPNPSYAKRVLLCIARCRFQVGESASAEALLSIASGTQLPAFSPLYLDILQSLNRIREAYDLYRNRPLSMAISSFFKKPKESRNISLENCDDKAVLVLSEGGPGDELRLSSIYTELCKHVRALTVTCDPRLESIMRRSFPSIDFLPVARLRREFAKPTADRTLITDARLFQCVSDRVISRAREVDIVCSVLDLLVEVRPDRASFKRCTRPLLKSDPLRSKRWKNLTGPGVNIGIAWRSMLHSVARSRHYFRVEDLEPFAQIKNGVFWLLQPNATEEEINQLRRILNLKIPEGLDLVDDFEEQIALVSNLDYVISPFTTSGELAGAVGVPTFLVSTSRNTRWRRESDGKDLFSCSSDILVTEEGSGIRSSIERAVVIIEGYESNKLRN